jgi:hypothetical protein
VQCSSPGTTLNEPLVIKWVLRYRTPSAAGAAPR